MTEKQSLRLILPLERLPAFSLFLQQGVWLQVQTGCSVADLLTDQFGIAEDYIVERITTLFLDFKPIDDLKTSYVNDGSTLALSSAMPGLVGTTMRRGSHLAAMRGDISCKDQQRIESGIGRIRIKLFNLVMTELGAIFLGHGVCLSSAELDNFLSAQDDGFLAGRGAAFWGDLPLDFTSLIKRVRGADPDAEILLKVEFTG
ncbi:hypothetical protein [Geopsychrobacter electrodiphilus]|uniref:hypothetical protein n=1 Tax=Geopsychrobacter electrodiphilus TaxID=225196 RepID=UPI00036E8584|nr:hypothetical protein [Geopsychrobacter electrodiphilus]